MNETTAIVMLYLMLVFSDWVPDLEVRYIFGWIFIGVFCANLAVHLFFLLRGLLKRVPFKLFIKCGIKRKQATKVPITKPNPTESLAVIEENKNEESSLDLNDKEEPSESNDSSGSSESNSE